jgi:PHS family inorganic phosphate transporter-like MFS transporter
LSITLFDAAHQRQAAPEGVSSVGMATRTEGGNAAFHNFNNDYAHIADPNERRRLALAEVDKAPFGWYHVRAILVAGIGFFTDAYDIFAIGIVTSMLGVVYWQDADLAKAVRGVIPPNSDTAIKVATSGGTVIGQLGFGWLADMVGRKKMYGLELILIIFATVAQALSSDSPAMSIVGTIIFWRVLMGGKCFSGRITMKAILTSIQLVSEVTTLSVPSSLPNSRRLSGVVL